LRSALVQQGPWQEQQFVVDTAWLEAALQDKIATIDWSAAAEDVRRFLDPAQQQSLRLWRSDFFLAKVKKLA
jgi:hypothetical protein